jgi:hypothetical protein
MLNNSKINNLEYNILQEANILQETDDDDVIYNLI